MKRLAVLSMVCLLAGVPITVMASEDLEARVAALEERVAALEAQIGAAPKGVSAAPEQETVDPGTVETGIVSNGCSLTFKRYEVAQDYSDEDVVILYFDFFNGSGKTTSAGDEFSVKVFQNGREQDMAIVTGNDAVGDHSVEFRSGADPVEVGFARELQDMSDIIVSLSPLFSWDEDPVEFTLSLE